jgi:hypothetical protein
MTKVLKDSECILSKEQCDKLEELRISLWNNTHKIEENAGKLVNDIDRLTDIILRTKQNPHHTSYLMDIRRTATFLESSTRGRIEKLDKGPEFLHDEKGKEYKKIGYFNNIISKISSDCDCPGSFPEEKTPKNMLETFRRK